MFAEIGNISLYIALLVSISIPLYKLWCSFSYIEAKKSVFSLLWLVELIFISIAFLSLIYCFSISDFSLLNVLKNSHSSNPLIYKIAASWGNHEGSMLLWVLSVSLFSLLFAHKAKGDLKLIQGTMVVQAVLMSCFLAFIICTSNPFVRIYPHPIDGLGFNPILQDIGITMHPPMLYLGYVGFSIVYSAAISGLWYRRLNSQWAKEVKPYVLFSWACLTTGITLGSWWAYRELGWGGFWFWDPVENASLMPWLLSCALIHSLTSLEKSNKSKSWCYILSIMTFSMSVIGTFIVRSGIITSVHAFATDPTRGIFILIFIGVILGLALLLKLSVGYEESSDQFDILSVNGFIYLNNLLLTIAAFTVALGTLYPKIIEIITGDIISVGPSYFNQMFAPIAISLAFLCAVSRNVSYKIKSLFISISILSSIVVFFYGPHFLTYMLLVLSGSVLLCFEMRKISFSKPSSIAHFAFGLLVVSLGFNNIFYSSMEKTLNVGDEMNISSYTLKLEDLRVVEGVNYLARQAVFDLKKGADHVSYLTPETRFFTVERQQTTETAIYRIGLNHIYVAVGQVYPDGSISVKAYINPMVVVIWAAGLLIALSGFIGFYRSIITL